MDASPSRKYWINLHALLHIRNVHDDAQWTFGEVSQMDNPGTAAQLGYRWLWPSRQRHGDRVAIVNVNGDIESTNTKNKRFSFSCQLHQRYLTRQTVQHERFRVIRMTSEEVSSPVNDDSHGCFESVPDKSPMKCALSCHLDSRCRSAYANSAINECRHALYVDSLLKQSDWFESPEGWTRYERPDWRVDEDGIKNESTSS
ncbi:unnamed protein product [Echinostoma caproni]|uniref:Apple domain-containing protein n=1 Tax=Echinostoma caproni TaxID=27848 RepID=A0A183ANC2_9TREM|nr:unnamed protein product [Echinostoma caproni]